jgi:hypothetical protein
MRDETESACPDFSGCVLSVFQIASGYAYASLGLDSAEAHPEKVQTEIEKVCERMSLRLYEAEYILIISYVMKTPITLSPSHWSDCGYLINCLKTDIRLHRKRMPKIVLIVLGALLLNVSSLRAQCYLAATWYDIPASCPFAADGSLCCDSIWGLTPGTGLPPYTCQITSPAGTYTYNNTSHCFTGLLPGSYNVSITSSDGCVGQFFNLGVDSEFSQLNLSAVNTTAATCAGGDGSICITVTGGSGSYSYAWTGPPAYNTTIGTGSCLNNLSPGYYQVVVSDNDHPQWCQLDASLYVGGTSQLQVTPVVNYNPCIQGPELPGCFTCQSSIDLTLVGGTAPFVYNWTGPGGFAASTQDINNICDGVYTINISDAGGCSYSNTFTIGAVIPYDVVGDVVISSNTIWNSVTPYGPEIIINGNIIVQPGATLTINSASVRLARGKTIRTLGSTNSLSGGQLVATNTTFTSANPLRTWRGFEVLGVGGNPSAALITAGRRSQLTLTNCVVENAETGIRNQKNGIACNGTITYNNNENVGNGITANERSSGRALCNGTTFRNNLRDINFQNYVPQDELGVANSELGRFVNCRFEYNLFPTCVEIYSATAISSSSERVRLNHVTAVYFESCEAIVLNTALTSGSNVTTQFLKASSSWFDWRGCVGTANCDASIIGFSIGISVIDNFNLAFFDYPGSLAFTYVSADRIIRIDETLFQCASGVVAGGNINGASSVQITGNRFEDTPASYGNTQGSTIANTRVRINNSSTQQCQFVISNNDFISTQPWDVPLPGISAKPTAIDVTNGGQALNNWIYANNLFGFWRGIYAFNNNRDPLTGSDLGLHFECNIFDDCRRDVDIQFNGTLSNSKCVAKKQAQFWTLIDAPDNSAGNDFSDSDLSGFGDDDIYRQGATTVPKNTPEQWYNVHTSEMNANFKTEMSYLEIGSPPAEDNNYSRLHADTKPIAHGCPTFYIPPTNSNANSAMGSYAQSYEEQKELLTQLQDNGNTNGLEQLVANTTFANAYQTYQNLLQASPQLSTEVMIAAIEKEFEIPTSWLTVILASNPHATQSAEILAALEARQIPLDAFQMDLIVNARTNQLTPYQLCQKMLGHYRYQLSDARQSYLQYVGSEVSGISSMDIAALFDETEVYSELLQKASEIRTAGDFDGARTMMLNAVNYHKLTQEEIDAIGTTVAIWDIEKAALTEQGGVLTEAQLSQLEHFWIDDPCLSGPQALQVLMALSNYIPAYMGCYALEERNATFSSNNTIPQNLNVYPNPATDFVVCKLEVPVDYDAYIELIDISGKLIHKISLYKGQQEITITTAKISVGEYILKMTDKDGNTISQSKFVKL